MNALQNVFPPDWIEEKKRKLKSGVICVNFKSKTYQGDQWVKAELQVRGSAKVKRLIDGEVVME